MSAAALLERVSQAGLTVRLDRGKVKLSGPPELVNQWAPELRQHREELAAHLADAEEWKAERAAILEFDAGLSREEADVEAARLHAAWLVTDRVYQSHHWRCPACIAASQGRGLRCGVGASLWIGYTERNPS
jgi:hypothetical protein